MIRIVALSFGLSLVLSMGCTTLPDDIPGYQDKCIRMNADPIAPTDDDPHEGYKEVYACDVGESDLKVPYPDGTVMVKESCPHGPCRDGEMVWLIATARKANGSWSWNEYTRNFEDEDFVEILADESVCTNCHKKVEALDWIYTPYQPN